MAYTNTDKKSYDEKYVEYVADIFCKSLDKDSVPIWNKPWASINHKNPETGTVYKRNNAFILSLVAHDREYKDSRWLTYAQAQAAGGQVRKGERGVPLRVCVFERKEFQFDKKGNPILDEHGQQKFEVVKLDKPIVSHFTVFNVAQIDFPLDHKYSQPEITQKWSDYQAAEDIIKKSGAQIEYKPGGLFGARYTPAKDLINIPAKEQFESPDGFYSTVFHEMSHWTGHPGRLNRLKPGTEEAYAKEEFVAEISSFMLCGQLGISHRAKEQVEYVKSWTKSLQNSTDKLAVKKELIEATKKAYEAQRFITGGAIQLSKAEKIYLDSSSVNQGMYLQMGAFFDCKNEKFYITEKSHDLSKFMEYIEETQKEKILLKQSKENLNVDKRDDISEMSIHKETQEKSNNNVTEKIAEVDTYLKVSFLDRKKVKDLGAKWDRNQKSWYVPAGLSLTKFLAIPDVAITYPPESFVPIKTAYNTQIPYEKQKEEISQQIKQMKEIKRSRSR